MASRDVAVVGSGSAGLAAAFRLHQAGHRVRLFETAGYVGGRMKTLHRDGFHIEQGGFWIPEGYTSLIGMINDLGLGDQLDPSGTTFTFPRDGRLHTLDCARFVRSGLRFDLLSTRSKLALGKLVKDCFQVRRQLGGGDLSALADWDRASAADYALTRTNREILDYIVNPILACVAGEVPERLSQVDLLYSFGTFLSGMNVFTLRDGMSAYAETIAGRLGPGAVELHAEVTAVEEHDDHVELTWRERDPGLVRGVERLERFDGCVLATPPWVTARLHTGLDPSRADFLRSARGVPAVNLAVAMRSVPPGYPSSWISVPDIVDPGLMLIGLTHNLCTGRTPAGKALVSVYTTPVLAGELYDAPDEVCTKRIIDLVDEVAPGLLRDIEFTIVERWDPILLVSRPGYYRELKEFNEIGSRADKRIQLAGDYFSVSSLNTACASGERAAAGLRL
jgi:oxygen-dependent protoporphyrinogen oxidase